jgi:hypothetical protein
VFVVAGLILALVGCHGGAQTDVVEREMRWQEDQIYAMEDYIQQYQQLLCEYRAENCALKRQINSGPGPKKVDSQVKRDEQNVHEEQGVIKQFDQPAVPPLIETLPDDSGAVEPMEYGPRLEYRPARRPNRGVRRTALEQSARQPAEPLVAPPADAQPIETADAPQQAVEEDQPAEPADSLQQVMVTGSVMPAHENTGPRLLVDVEPLGASGGPAAFEGELSLMVLDTRGSEPRGVARWDFTQQQLAEMLGDQTGPTMEFPLQLPPDAPTDVPLELWVRLVPAGGEKLLAHADVDLQQAGQFSSDEPSQETVAQPIAAEPDERAAENQTANVSTGDWNGWHLAQPGQVVEAPADRRQAASQWRKATEPIPTAVNYGRPVTADTQATEPAAEDRLARRDKAADVKPPAWSPVRQGNPAAASTDAAPPAWSPQR